MNRIYLAARYNRRLEMCGRAKDLEALDYHVTSTWICGNSPLSIIDDGVSLNGAWREEWAEVAIEDMAQLFASHILIAFTEASDGPRGRGGRHVEFGMALARGMRLIVVGPRETVFHCLGSVEQYDTWDDALAQLRSEQ